MANLRRSNFPNFPSMLENFFSRGMSEFDDFFQRKGNMPAVNIQEKENEFLIDVAAPGLKKEDFKLHLDNNVLTISSEKEYASEDKDERGSYTRHEFSYQSFSRSFTLPEMANADQIKANYQDGILKISIPKREDARKQSSRTIDIS